MNGSIRKRGNSWSYCFDLGTVNGKRKRKEKSGFRTKTEAQQALRKAITEYENSGNVFKPSEITVTDYLNFWLKEHSTNIKYNSVRLYDKYINNHIIPYIGNYKLKAITPAKLQSLINNIYKQGYSKSLVSCVLAILTNSLKKAVYPYQYIKENPAQYVTLPKYEKQSTTIADKILTDEEFKQIISKYKDTVYYIPLMIGYYTGFRIGEVLALTWDNVDLVNNKITVSATLIDRTNSIYELGTPKTTTSNRTIVVSQTLINILKEHRKKQLENKLFYGQYYSNFYLDENNLICRGSLNKSPAIEFVCSRENGDYILPSSFNHLKRMIKKHLGINFYFHSLRHTHATKLLEAGANPKDVQYRLGHSNFTTTTNTYMHVTETMEKETALLFDKVVGKL